MLARFGHVVYWGGCALAALTLLLAAGTAFTGSDGWDWEAAAPVALLAALIWGFGRAGRYVFAGD